MDTDTGQSRMPLQRLVLVMLPLGAAAAMVSWPYLGRPEGRLSLAWMDDGSSRDRLLETLLATDQVHAPEAQVGHRGNNRTDDADDTPKQNVRVALYRHFPVQSIEVRGHSRCRSRSRKTIKTIDMDQWTDSTLNCTSDGISGVFVNGKNFQGSVSVLRKSEGWLAINQVPMEHYVASVVGSEMPSQWAKEALRAQAVAVRSYAWVHLVRPTHQQFHLGDTERWQVYRGRESSTKETVQAAQSTAGQVLSFQGALVESLYAATHEIAKQAHAHLGASMSQAGAQQLAQQGRTYTEILDWYYNGAELARIKRNGH